jgi:hypothetical protein
VSSPAFDDDAGPGMVESGSNATVGLVKSTGLSRGGVRTPAATGTVTGSGASHREQRLPTGVSPPHVGQSIDDCKARGTARYLSGNRDYGIMLADCQRKRRSLPKGDPEVVTKLGLASNTHKSPASQSRNLARIFTESPNHGTRINADLLLDHRARINADFTGSQGRGFHWMHGVNSFSTSNPNPQPLIPEPRAPSPDHHTSTASI